MHLPSGIVIESGYLGGTSANMARWQESYREDRGYRDRRATGNAALVVGSGSSTVAPAWPELDGEGRPLPSSLWTSIAPPWLSTIPRLTDKPSPCR